MDTYVKADLVKMLSFFYGTMIASVPLLEFAMERTDGELRDYYEDHIIDENGHDAMLLSDLYRLGVAEPQKFHYAAQFAGAQYYLIAHDDPALLLGYMRALESSVMLPDEVDKLSAHHGVELTSLKHHAVYDPDHTRDLDAMIAELPDNLRERVLLNEENTRQMLLNARI